MGLTFIQFDLYILIGHNGNGILTPDDEHPPEDGRSGEEEVIEIEESNSSVIGSDRRPESSLKSEVKEQ